MNNWNKKQEENIEKTPYNKPITSPIKGETGNKDIKAKPETKAKKEPKEKKGAK